MSDKNFLELSKEVLARVYLNNFAKEPSKEQLIQLFQFFDADKNGDVCGLEELSNFFNTINDTRNSNSVFENLERVSSFENWFSEPIFEMEEDNVKMKRFITFLQNAINAKNNMDGNSSVQEFVTYDDQQRPIQVIKMQNGVVVAIKNLEYFAETDENIAYVKIETQLANDIKITTMAKSVDASGNVSVDNLLEEVCEDSVGNKSSVHISGRVLCEEKIMTSGRKSSTFYDATSLNGSDLSAYYNCGLNRLYQQVEDATGAYCVSYDQNQNTKVVVQLNETIEVIAQKYGVSVEEFKEVNPQFSSRKPRAGEEIVIPKIFDADCLQLKMNLSSEEIENRYQQERFTEAYNTLLYSRIEETIVEKSTDWFTMARELLIEQGLENPSAGMIERYVYQLELLNKDVNLQVGAKIKYSINTIDNITLRDLSSLGFKPDLSKHNFYEKFQKLSQEDRDLVLNFLRRKGCYDSDDYRQELLMELYSQYQIDLFLSNITIPMKESSKSGYHGVNGVGLEQYDVSNPFSFQNEPEQIPLEVYVKNILNVDITSPRGKLALQLLSQLTPEQLEQCPKQPILQGQVFEHNGDLKYGSVVFNEAEDPRVNEVINTIISLSEYEILGRKYTYQYEKQQMKLQNQKEIPVRAFAIGCVEYMYNYLINYVKQYQSEAGLVGTLREGAGQLLSLVNPFEVETCFADTVENLEKERDEIIKNLQESIQSQGLFEMAFRENFGVDFNLKLMQDLMDDENIDLDSQKFIKAFTPCWQKDDEGKCFIPIFESTIDRVDSQAKVDGFLDFIWWTSCGYALAKTTVSGVFNLASKYIPANLLGASIGIVAYDMVGNYIEDNPEVLTYAKNFGQNILDGGEYVITEALNGNPEHLLAIGDIALEGTAYLSRNYSNVLNALGGSKGEKVQFAIDMGHSIYNKTKPSIKKSIATLDDEGKQVLSDFLVSGNEFISNQFDIPVSQIAMNISLANPENVREENYWTAQQEVLEDVIARCQEIPSSTVRVMREDMPLVYFNTQSLLSKTLSKDPQVLRYFEEWLAKPEAQRESFKAPIALEEDYDMYATFHNIRVLNPRVEGEYLVADVFDIYDFAPGPVTDQILAIATPVAVALQDNGIIKNYKILTQVKIPLSAIQ